MGRKGIRYAFCIIWRFGYSGSGKACRSGIAVSQGFAKDMVSEIRRYLTIQARNPQNIHKLTTLSSKGQGKNQPPYVGVIHRLDRPVSGIMVYARNQKAAASLSSLMQQGKMEKWYKAVVCGKPVDNHSVYVDYLRQNQERTGLKLWINRQQEVNGQSFHIWQRHRQSAVTRGEQGIQSGEDTSAYRPPPPDPGTIFRPWNTPLWGW